MAASTVDDVEKRLREIISNLYMLMVQAHNYQGAPTQQAIKAETQGLVRNLIELQKSAQHLPIHVPVDLINFVEDSRNPDVYIRMKMEEAMRDNQRLKGRSDAFASFRDILAQQMAVGIPEIKDDVRRVVEASGGRGDT